MSGKNFRKREYGLSGGTGWYSVRWAHSRSGEIFPMFIYTYKNGKWRGVHWGRGQPALNIHLFGPVDECVEI